MLKSHFSELNRANLYEKTYFTLKHQQHSLPAFIPLRVGGVSCNVLSPEQGQCRHCCITALLSKIRPTLGQVPHRQCSCRALAPRPRGMWKTSPDHRPNSRGPVFMSSLGELFHIATFSFNSGLLGMVTIPYTLVESKLQGGKP